MDKAILVIGFFFMVVAVPVIAGVLSDMHKRRMKLRERELELLGSQTAEKAAQYAAHTERLEQRVRVLEQIATDQGVTTAAQIEALRHAARVGAPQIDKGGNA
jgi:hypothetical protein